ncbi:MAG: hypothetical protein LH618_09460 [Saprospiraceae bacterium]|nr:hypothetical protein [Saprospiraceae bacterium]
MADLGHAAKVGNGLGLAVTKVNFLNLKSLLKKYSTLNDDLDVVKKVLAILPDERPPFSFRIDNLGLETGLSK